MKDQKLPLNQADEPSKTTALFDVQVKAARIKSAIVAAVPTIIIFIAFAISPPFEKAIGANLIALFLLTIVPFTFVYQLVFSLGFGKNMLPELQKRQRFEPAPFMHQRDDQAIDAFNAANGYGPGIGFLMPKKHFD